MNFKYVLSAFLFASSVVSAGEIEIDVKQRLPETINSYQPAIVPVCDFDETKLWFDRKYYFENTGGIHDNDDIWTAKMPNGFNSAQLPCREPEPLNTKQSDVMLYLSPDGNRAMFSGQYYENSPKFPGYSIARKDKRGNWTLPDPMNIRKYKNDSLIYSASLSPDMQILILSLANSGGVGGMDLFVSFYDKAKEAWSEPKNLGLNINSKFDEVSPCLAANNRTLYFASNDPNLGLGGYDLYKSERLDDTWTNWSKPENFGKPYNTIREDNNIRLNSLGDYAYIVSYDTTVKRQGIYRIKMPENFRPKGFAYIRGKAMLLKDKKSNPIAGRMKIQIVNIALKDTIYAETNPTTAEYIVPITENGDYSVQIISEKYNSKSEILAVSGDEPKVYLQDVYAFSPDAATAQTTGDEQLTSAQLREKRTVVLHFEYNLSELSGAESRKLQQLIAEYSDKKHLKFRISAHTDTLGTEEYNYKLSLERAETAEKYLINCGIERSRIISTACGETKPLTLKKEEQAENRRVEIEVTEDY